MMRFDVITLFPEAFPGILGKGVIGRAISKGIIRIETHNPRDFTTDRHRTVDDAPYGGGPGMVMKAQPVVECVESLDHLDPYRILLSPQGTLWNQSLAKKLSRSCRNIVLICGRYEGVDERIRDLVVDLDVSVGDYVLAGGEVAAMVIIETISRLIEGVVGDPKSVESDSLEGNLLKFPQYTRPAQFRNIPVPEILLSGNHAEIAKWRRQKSLIKTKNLRPDLFSCKTQTDDDNTIQG